jgi:hypothetical protein
MQIGLYVDKKTHDVLYVKESDGDVWIATSFEGEKIISVSEESNYQKIDYSLGTALKNRLRRKAGWLEKLLSLKFTESGEIRSSEVLRQIRTLKIKEK